MLASSQGGSAWATDWLGGDKTSVVLASECMSGDHLGDPGAHVASPVEAIFE
jgi:hypothetical protein